MSEGTEVLEVKSAQRDRAKRATLEALISKPRKRKEFDFTLGDEAVSILMEAIGSVAYDKLMSKAPPTPEQKVRGLSFDVDKFGPLLLAAVVLEPQATVEDWSSIWKSDDWSGGEIGELYQTAVGLCGTGLDLAPTEAG